MADEDNKGTVSTESIDNKSTPPIQNTETVIQDGQTGQTKVVDTSGEVPAGASDKTADIPQPEPSTEAKQWAQAPGSNDASLDPVQVDPPPSPRSSDAEARQHFQNHLDENPDDTIDPQKDGDVPPGKERDIEEAMRLFNRDGYVLFNPPPTPENTPRLDNSVGGEQDTGKSNEDGDPIVSAPPADMTVSQSAASVAQIEDSKANPDEPTLSPVPDILVPASGLSDDEKNELVLPMFQSHKRVRGLKIAKVHYHVVAFEDQRFMARTMRDFVERHNPSSGGWYIVHSDGTEDYYPSDFENDFHPIG